MRFDATVTLHGWPERGQQLLAEATAWRAGLLEMAGDIADDLENKAAELSPIGKNHGAGPRFADSWRATVEPNYGGGASVTLGNIAPHAAFVLGDTAEHEVWAAHLIGTRSKKVSRSIGPGEQYPLRSVPMGLGFLKFEGRNGITFRHHVMIPAHAGNPVHEKVMQEMEPEIEGRVESYVQQLGGRLQAVFQKE